MNRVEFMKQLEHLLTDIPENDRLDAIAYYNDYFDEAGVDNEAQVIRELGSPGRVAAMIKADLNESEGGKADEKPLEVEVTKKEKTKKNFPWALVIVLLVFASPILIGVFGGVFGGLLGILCGILGIFVALLACAIALTVSGIVLIIVGIVRLAVSPVEGLLTLGIGCLLFALGLLFTVLSAWILIKWLPALFRGCVNLFQKIFLRKEGRNRV